MFLCPSRPLFQRTQEIVIVCARARVSAVYIRLHPQCTTTTQCRIVVHRPQYCVAPIKYIGCIVFLYIYIHLCMRILFSDSICHFFTGWRTDFTSTHLEKKNKIMKRLKHDAYESICFAHVSYYVLARQLIYNYYNIIMMVY